MTKEKKTIFAVRFSGAVHKRKAKKKALENNFKTFEKKVWKEEKVYIFAAPKMRGKRKSSLKILSSKSVKAKESKFL